MHRALSPAMRSWFNSMNTKRYWGPIAIILLVVAVCFLAQIGGFDYGPSGLHAAVTGVNITTYTPVPSASPTVGQVTINWNNGPYARILPIGNPAGSATPVNLATPVNPVDGTHYTIEFQQNGVAGAVINYPAGTFVDNSNAPIPTPTSTGSADVVWQMNYNAQIGKYVVWGK